MSMPKVGSTTPIDLTASELAAPRASEADKIDGAGFGESMLQALSNAGQLERNAADQSEKFANGDPNVGIHEVMLAAEKANIGVRYVVTLKNRALEAYRELMQTPL